jgi:hypothetical protein
MSGYDRWFGLEHMADRNSTLRGARYSLEDLLYPLFMRAEEENIKKRKMPYSGMSPEEIDWSDGYKDFLNRQMWQQMQPQQPRQHQYMYPPIIGVRG